ncbi:TRAP transporter small permease [Yoonia sp. SS1-5]|uniref:TRAP transporter small permease protein n=1 Tax=Yoonia rhodophyticola TaxID=3137370 RepID=A0AAN0MDR3_9RHOB
MSAPATPPRPHAQRLLDQFGHLFVLVGAIGILVLLALTAIGVFWRYVLNDPIFGLQDLVSMTSAVVVACAVAYGAISNTHITVNIMPAHFGRPVRRVTDVVARGIGVTVLGLSAFALVKKAGCGLACGQITGNLNIAHGPFYLTLAAAMGFFALYQLVQLWAGLMHWRDEDPNEAIS